MKKKLEWYQIKFYLPDEKNEISYGIYVYGSRELAIKKIKELYPKAYKIK